MSDILKGVYEKREEEYLALCRELGEEPMGMDIDGFHWRELLKKKEDKVKNE